MTEIIRYQAEAADQPPLPDIEAAVAECTQFIGDMAPDVGKMFGIPHIKVSVGEGWATNLETGDVTADPRFFLERGYTPNMSAYALVHEVSAHLREVVYAPALTHEVKNFVTNKVGKPDTAKSIFHNILSDIAGNNLTHAIRPDMTSVAKELYRDKLFPETDYREKEPRHLQFLYKVIRQEMIPDSHTEVVPEVDQLIEELRDFEGAGDLIKYSTQVAKSSKVAMPAEERFTLWKNVIYPKWQKLVELDKQDPQWQTSEGQAGESDFSERYNHYREEVHPEPMSDEEHEAIHKAVHEKQRQNQQRSKQEQKEQSPEYQLDKKIRAETGHSLEDQRAYQVEVLKWAPQIRAMRELYRSIIHEQVAAKRALRGVYSEGALLNPDRLAQTYIDVQTGTDEPAAFHSYEQVAAEREISGKTDYVFVFDRSGSMDQEGKCEAAAAALVICLEGLDGMQRDIKAAEQEADIELNLDIRTALYTFNEEVSCPKPLGHGLTSKQRLDAYGEVRQPGGGNADSTVLSMVEALEIKPDRRKILVMVADGEADNPTEARASVNRLRNNGWLVYGVSIGSEAAVQLYAPTSQRVDDPVILPDVMKRFIESTVS